MVRLLQRSEPWSTSSPASSAEPSGSPVLREAFFLDTPRGRRFCLATRPRGAPLGGLLYLPPFAEELNKTRRMAALGAQAFAARGWLVLQPDLLGCGDSEGDFGDAGWQDWLDDIDHAHDWLRRHAGPVPLALWSLRAGSLLATDWLSSRGGSLPLLLWQPVLSGKQHLTQFLRLAAASEMLADADARAAVARVRAALQDGETVEIAGYRLSARLAAGLDAAAFGLPEDYAAPLVALETGGGGGLSPALAAALERLRNAGREVRAEAVRGPAFWQTVEIETAAALIEASVGALEVLRR